MKKIVTFIVFIFILNSCQNERDIVKKQSGYSIKDDKISTIDFVQIIGNNKEETLYYFQNNWKVLRDMAIDEGYIHSYQFLETPIEEGEPFQLMLITTYLNENQYKLREYYFSELIERSGDLKLLNDKRPNQFRRTLFSKEMVRHWK